MNFPLFLAKRYFKSKHKKNFIQVIARISMVVVAVGTMALIISLSVFNGLEGLLRKMYGSFDPDIIIYPNKGKSIVIDSALIKKVSELPGIEGISPVVEDNALIKYKESQRVVKVKGVAPNYHELGGYSSSMVSGEPNISPSDSLQYAVIGRGIQYDLSINTKDPFYELQLFYPNEIKPGVINPSRMYTRQFISVNGVFAFEKNYDENYVFVPLVFAQKLLSYGNRVNNYELFTENKTDKELLTALQKVVGDNYRVVSGDELHSDLFKIIKIEKLFVFLILSAIIAIASINIFFSLTMLVIEKKKDLAMLKTQGATSRQIFYVFINEGFIIAFTGAFIGMLLGLSFLLIQEKFGVVGMGMSTAVVSSYPVKIESLDVLYVSLSIILITILAALQPAIKASKVITTQNLH